MKKRIAKEPVDRGVRTLAKSRAFIGGAMTAPCSVWVRVRSDGEIIVHTRNEQTGGFFNGMYTRHLPSALDTFKNRVVDLERGEKIAEATR